MVQQSCTIECSESKVLLCSMQSAACSKRKPAVHASCGRTQRAGPAAADLHRPHAQVSILFQQLVAPLQAGRVDASTWARAPWPHTLFAAARSLLATSGDGSSAAAAAPVAARGEHASQTLPSAAAHLVVAFHNLHHLLRRGGLLHLLNQRIHPRQGRVRARKRSMCGIRGLSQAGKASARRQGTLGSFSSAEGDPSRCTPHRHKTAAVHACGREIRVGKLGSSAAR